MAQQTCLDGNPINFHQNTSQILQSILNYSSWVDTFTARIISLATTTVLPYVSLKHRNIIAVILNIMLLSRLSSLSLLFAIYNFPLMPIIANIGKTPVKYQVSQC